MRFALGWLLVSTTALARPQENGLPLVRQFSPREFGAIKQVFDAAQTPDGRMVFAAPADFSLIVYNGQRWTTHSLSVSPVSLDVDDEGRLWIGSNRSFGYLKDHGGKYDYVALEDASVRQDATYLSFIQTRATPDGVWFLSKELLARWDGVELRTWRAPPRGGFMDLEITPDGVFLLEGSQGLLHLEEGEFSESDALGHRRIPFEGLCARDGDLIGVWIDGDGIHWVDGHGTHTTNPDPATDGANYVSDVVLTPEGTLCVATSTGVLVGNPEREDWIWLEQGRGLPSSVTYSLELDREGGIWACQAYGVSRIDPSPAARWFGKELGLQGAPLSLERHRGRLFCGTVDGLFSWFDDGFVHVDAPLSLPVFDLLSTEHGLLVGTELALFSLGEGQLTGLSSEEPLLLAPCPEDLVGDVETVLVATFDSVRLLRWTGEDGWQFEPGIQPDWGTSDLEFGSDALWFQTYDREVIHVPFDGFRYGRAAYGDPTRVAGTWEGIERVGDSLLLWNQDRIAILDEETREIRTFTGLDWDSLNGADPIQTILGGEAGEALLVGSRSVRLWRPAEEDRVEVLWASQQPVEGAWRDLSSAERWLWVVTHEGLLRVEPAEAEPLPDWGPTILVRAENGPWTNAFSSPLPAQSSVTFEVSDSSMRTDLEYRYRLDGLEKGWSPWTFHPFREHMALPGGHYVFRVQTGLLGVPVSEASVPFEVRRRWFFTWPALLTWATLFFLATWSLIRFRALRLKARNDQLEAMVLARTRELEEERQRVLERTEELARVNDQLRQEMEARSAIQERLEVAERLESLGTVAGGIAHDFNNYLTSIQGYAELTLEDPSITGEAARNLRDLTLISRQASELCSSLLSLAGRTPLVRQAVDLTQTVRDMAPLVRSSMADRGILEMDLDEHVPAIEGDIVQLRRALVNLVLNAAEACKKNGRVVVRTGARACTRTELEDLYSEGVLEPGAYTFLEVEDNGEGLTEEARRHLFDPFFTTKLVGRGLGLTTVFRIVTAHGGGIDVWSERGVGTRIRLYIPCASQPATAVRPIPEVERSLLRGRVLIVDDDDSVRTLGSRLCRHLGLDVVTASSGPQALEILARSTHGIDAVFLDLSMPGMDGREVLREIRRFAPELPVLLTSGYVPEARPVDDPRTDFLAKPFSLGELAKALAAALAQHRQGSPR